MSESDYDLVVLGGGGGAFAAVTEATARGHSTAIVNTGLPLGGTCVNVGCVPSKHLLAVAETAAVPRKNSFEAVAYDDGQPRTDWATAIDATADLVDSFRQRNYVDVAAATGTDVYEGFGRFVDGTTVDVVDGADEGTRVRGRTVVVATGGSPRIAPIEGIETVDYETSESILERRERPESVVVIGGGYVGCEWGQILSRLGVDVTILQRSSHVLSGLWSELGRELQLHLREEDISVLTDATPRNVLRTDDGGVVVEASVDGRRRTVRASDLFVATGVTPNTDDVGLGAAGIETDDRGAVVADEHLQTAHPDVYAVGDCNGEPMLETVAAKEGNYAVRNAIGDESATVEYGAVPTVLFTDPEVATVGWTEPEYLAEHGTCTCRTIRMDDVPKAQTIDDTRGLVQVVKHHETDEVVGVHMVAARAADMIPEATLAVKHGLTVDDVVDTVHPFPTLSEAFKRACQAFRRDVSTMSCCIE